MLDRRDVDDHAGSLREHGRQQRAIEPHRRHQVEIDLFPPRLVVECGEPAGRRLEPPSTLTTMSMPPKWSSALCATRVHPSAVVMFAAT